MTQEQLNQIVMDMLNRQYEFVEYHDNNGDGVLEFSPGQFEFTLRAVLAHYVT